MSTSTGRQKLKRETIFVTCATVLISIVSAIWWDSPLSKYWRDPAFTEFHLFNRKVTDLALGDHYFLITGVLLVLSAIAARLKFGENVQRVLIRIRTWSIFSLISLVSVGLALLSLKFLFGRKRPHIDPVYESLHFEPFNLHWNWHSFPSGHSQVIFVVATILGLLVPRAKWPLLIFAFAIALTRVVTQQHFLSDVFAGSALGYLGTKWVHAWFSSTRFGRTL